MTQADDAESGISRRRAHAQGSKKRNYAHRRAEIITAAAELFRMNGYQSTSLAQIAEAIGTDRASLYYYFSSKEEVFDIIVTDVVEQNLAIAEGIRDSEASAVDKLHRVTTQLMTSYAENFPFLYIYLQENMAQISGKRQAWAERMRAVNRRYERAIGEMIQQGLDEGTIKAVAPAWVIANGLMGMISWTNRWFNPQTSSVSAAEIGAAYAEILLTGIVNTAALGKPSAPA